MSRKSKGGKPTNEIVVTLRGGVAERLHTMCHKTGIKDVSEVIYEAFDLLERCVDEAQRGRKIASLPGVETGERATILMTAEMLEMVAVKYASVH